MTSPQIGVGFQSDKTPDEYTTLARLAEAGGADVLSVYGDFGFQPPIVALTVMARATSRVRLGPACLNPFSLAPFEIASQIATLDLVSDGRAYLGLARGAWLEPVGIDQRRSVTRIREAVEVSRRLLAGDRGGYEGEVFRLAPDTVLHIRPVQPDPPVMIGTWGSSTLAMAGELADEVKLGGSANADVVPWAREQLARGACRAGRDPEDVGVCVGAVTVVDGDGTQARARARREVAMYLAVVAELDPTFDVATSVLQRVREHVGAGDHEAAGRVIPDEVLDRFAFAGTPEEVARHAESVIEAGATRIEFGTPHGLTGEQGLKLLGDRVIPHFR